MKKQWVIMRSNWESVLCVDGKVAFFKTADEATKIANTFLGHAVTTKQALKILTRVQEDRRSNDPKNKMYNRKV